VHEVTRVIEHHDHHDDAPQEIDGVNSPALFDGFGMKRAGANRLSRLFWGR
jgi:hypothetical protein